uniref:Serpentine receptor class gamma n=1 Tax=Caenorhabditis japonica TaxID=281687 RepID=A0A8R1DJ39_CAEJA
MWMLMVNLIYSIPSLLLYFITAIVIRKNWKKLKSSFFIWYLYDFAMNCLTMIFTFITLKTASATCQTCLLAPFYRTIQDTVISQFLYSMMYHMSYTQYCTTAVISVNRLSIILNHYTFEKLWLRFSIIPMFVICFAPFTVNFPIFSSNCTWGSREDKTFVLFCDVPSTRLYNPLIIFQVACIICSIVCNFISFLVVIKSTTEIKKRLESNFIVLISITTVVQLAGTVITIILNGNSNTSIYKVVHTYVLPFISDGFTIMHPWLLVVLSKPVRHLIRRDIFKFESASVEPHNSGATWQQPQYQHNQQHIQQNISRLTISKY